jgi:citrate lyase subunit beta/citryl-CoA lyase
VLDLEDAVAADAKVAARAAVAAILSGPDAARLVVRINDASTDWHAADVALLAAAAAPTVMLPKAERADHIAALRAACPAIGVLALVETARGVLAAEAIAAAPGVQRLVFGTLDFALDLGLEAPDAMTLGLDHAASRIAHASRAAGLAAPVAGVTTALDDEAQLRADFARARAHGFGAKLCIHPKQIGPIHAALAPTADELAWAHRVLAAAQAAGGAAVKLDGRMVDKPVIERARRLVARAHP